MARKNAKPRYWSFLVMYDHLPKSWHQKYLHDMSDNWL